MPLAVHPHPRLSEIVRHFSLEIVNNAVQSRRLDAQSLGYIKDGLMSYIRDIYAGGSGRDAVDTAHIQNKLTQTVTYLFTSLYASGWETFFDDFRALAGDHATIGRSNVPATILYLRILGSIHDEIADVLMARTSEEQRRNTELKDLVRTRDAQKISLSWQEILAQWRQTDLNVIEMCLRTISRWVSWIDISLVVNQAMLNSLFEIAGQPGALSSESPEGKVRDAAIDTFTETVGKKMRATDKIQLIDFLNLGNVVGQLIASPPLAELRATSNYDTDLAETVAKLVNTAVSDIVKVLDSYTGDEATSRRADELLQVFVPYLLRFFGDEYDEICSTVVPSLTDLLTFFRKIIKGKNTLPAHYAQTLPAILEAIISKMKYDATASWGEEDEETDEAEFQELRKRLHVLQQTIATIDENLYIDTLSRIVAGTFSKLESGGVDWRELDLALHEMYHFGELAVRNGGLYQKREPSSVAASRLIEMMAKMVESDIASYPHPAIQLQYMEICVRYSSFFEQNPALVPKALEKFVTLTHSSHVRVRSRSWYFFLRFVRPLRNQLGNVSQTVIQAIGDLLTIKAEVPEDSGDDDMSSDEADKSADAMFSSQLYLFEAIGCLSSPPSVPLENKILYAQSVINPLFADIERNLERAKNGDEQALLQIHHIIMALGTLAKGFNDWTPGASGAPPRSEVSDEFERASEATLIALESLKSSMNVRSAARFAFARFLGVLGARVLQQLPRWIDGLLSENSTKDEMATFLRLLDQVVFGFKAETSGILDTLLTPLLQRVFTGLAEPVTGTDDEIQLAELRREYLNFLLVILNQDLGSILVSGTNQPVFQTIISTIEHFARDPSDYPTARLAISGFNPRDAQARQVLLELAGLQAEILKKNGTVYLDALRGQLRGSGVDEQGVEEYVNSIVRAGEKAWKNFFVQFISRYTRP
ncbi:pre-tRNA nuclear export protein [Coniosporium tulheliwenetii]|uniref:Pre-tRNA nuclear export protein n=1 Tax=Coniosporium tulheliwenetii TaxID=3383036 RepID=A0ACC2Z726_9PEZI|nr:pre-tRNA nuclear export protein [Cladosporium sp. JES 115]